MSLMVSYSGMRQGGGVKPRGQCNPSLRGRGEAVRTIQVWQPRAGWGLGTVDMGKISELPINIVKIQQAKEADKLEPKRYPDKV